MAEAPLGLVTEYLHRVVAPLAAMTDAELLARYVRERDEDAFAHLLRRHGPMVLGVCRRALGPSPDADDAFQATFVALARQAWRVRDNVPGWLFRVAVRASRRALRMAGRSEPGPEAVNRTDDLAAVEWREVRRLLDAELDRLPARWRSPLVLCYLDGLTRDEAAKRLDWSLRTLHRRLEEGRRRLRERLTRRGLGPAVLAAAVLAADDLRCEVPPAQLRTTAGLTVRGATVPVAVRLLVPTVTPTGGLVVKAILSAVILMGGLAVALSDRQASRAAPPPAPNMPPVLVRAPIGKERSPDDPLFKKAQKAEDRATKWLMANQEADGTWEVPPYAGGQTGGATALVVLALLESGTKADADGLKRAMEFLRKLDSKQVYVVALQTHALCAADQKQDTKRIERNVQWLEKAAARGDGGKLFGWSYTDQAGGRADNSNSRYAVAALYAAHRAGFKTAGEGFWEKVRDLYVRSQLGTGGWGYVEGLSRETPTMTASGTLCLALARKALKGEDGEGDQAVQTGVRWLAANYQIDGVHTYYGLDVVAALGRARQEKAFGEGAKARPWYREGCEWLFRQQKDDGQFVSSGTTEKPSAIATAFALRFLASRPD